MIPLDNTTGPLGPTWQITATIIILAVAIVVVAIKAWRMFHPKNPQCGNTTCSCCPIKDGCNTTNKNIKK